MKVVKENSLLEADAAVQKAAQEVGAEDVEVVDKNLDGKPNKEEEGVMATALTKALKTAVRKANAANKTNKRAKDFPNVLFIGGAGIGKTAQVESWAEKHGVNLLLLQGSALDAADMGGLPIVNTTEKDPETGEERPVKVLRAQKVSSGILDQLDEPNSVLFLDELNRAPGDVRSALLTLINNHTIQDFTAKGGMRYFPNFLFTVAAINPSDKQGYNTYKLDRAEKERFRNVPVKAENSEVLKWLVDKYNYEAELFSEDDPEEATASLGRAALAKAIVGSVGFQFDEDKDLEKYDGDDDWNELGTSPRNLTALLDNCDGTKDDLLAMWDNYCNNKQLSNIKRALQGYKDVDDKANSVFKRGTQSSLMNKKSGVNALRNKYGQQ